MIETDIVAAFVKALQNEINSGLITGDKADSADVAMQCIKDIYSLTDAQVSAAGTLSIKPVISEKDISDVDRAQAEEYKAKGNESLAAKRYDDAIEAYTKAIELNPTSAVYYCNRAAAYISLNMHQDAVEDAKRALERNPGYAKAYGRMGAAYFAQGHYDMAVDAYEHALAIEPENISTKASLETARQRLQRASTEPAASPSSPFGNLDFSKLAGNPALMSMAREMLNSGALKDIMNNPAAKQMMQNYISKGGMGGDGPSVQEEEEDQ